MMTGHIELIVSWLETSIAGVALWRIVFFFLLLLAAMIVGKVLKQWFLRQSERLAGTSREVIGVLFKDLSASISLVALAIGFRIGITLMNVQGGVAELTNTAADMLLVVAVTWMIYGLVDVVDWSLRKVALNTGSQMNMMLAPFVRKSLRITVVVLGVLQGATMLSDKPLTAVVASLGVGTIAISLAAQDTIKNLFGSIVLLTDRPFEIGDRITVDSTDGNVEEVGFRSTRVRTLDGHLVIVPNADMSNKSIRNITKRPYIKQVMNLGVTYDTPPEKVNEALTILQELLANHEGQSPDFPPRIYFNEFKDFSLNILVIYWYTPPDYWAVMAFQQKLCLAILDRFNQAGISFAFPSQTIYLEKGGAAPGA
ncbi:MAG: mechanosensitive ion channel family protein [Kiritimatiellae bacterium]|nr:mechanosensitive ion channel family protein [Kiritimatiellia bacterium]MDD4736423.1 mechanosensitive ion channel family protein [Kiritimatiellia bacterium]